MTLESQKLSFSMSPTKSAINKYNLQNVGLAENPQNKEDDEYMDLFDTQSLPQIENQIMPCLKINKYDSK